MKVKKNFYLKHFNVSFLQLSFTGLIHIAVTLQLPWKLPIVIIIIPAMAVVLLIM